MQQYVPLQLPNFYNLLSDIDRYQYNVLRTSFSAQQCNKNQRNKRVENFTETLETIKRFCCRGDGNDWRRFLVCGVCWLPEGIAINTRQLKLLIFKCKSSINGSLHKMGLSVNLGRTEAANAIVMSIPYLKDNLNELRQWTVRQIGTQCVSPISPPTPQPYSTPKPFEIPMINIVAQQTQQQQQPKPLPIPIISLPQQKQETIEEFPSLGYYDYPRDEEESSLSLNQPSTSFAMELMEDCPCPFHEEFW